jgi:hypothetical protein
MGQAINTPFVFTRRAKHLTETKKVFLAEKRLFCGAALKPSDT